MSGKIQIRLAILAALAALVAVVVPSGLVMGAEDGPIIGDDTGILLLDLGSTNEVTWEDESLTQAIDTRRNRCTPVTPSDDPELLAFITTGGDLGYVDGSLGVRSSGEGNSGKCAQINFDAGEAITVSLGSDTSGYLLNAIDLDLELKFDATVKVEYKLDGAVVGTDSTFDGIGADDGPDSADGDNYRYNSEVRGFTDLLFDTVVITPLAGAVSLEAGADGTEDGLLEPGNNDSQFRIAQVFDGVLDCFPASAQIGASGVDTTYGTVIMRSQDQGSGWILDECLLKPYNADTASAALSYVPELSGTDARYTIDVNVEDQLIDVDTDSSNSIPDGTITSLVAVYNETGDLTFPAASTQPLQSCGFTPPTNDTDASYNTFWQQSSPVDNGVLPGGGGDNTGLNLLPTGEIACFYSAMVSPTGLNGDGDQIGTEQWSIYFEDDPGLGFR